jgi:hypothetical protein
MQRLCTALAFLSLALGGTAHAQNYSADIVDLAKPGAPTLAKIWVTKDKKRIEFQPASGDRALVSHLAPAPPDNKSLDVHISGVGKTIILDLANKKSVILEPEQKAYIDRNWGDPAPSDLYRMYLFLPPLVNLEDACAEWVPIVNGARCKKAGYELVDGRRTIKYELTAGRDILSLWVDTRLHTLAKRKNNWTDTELRNVHEGQQPPSLFEIPAGYMSWPLGIDGVVGEHQPE